jgi:hypothetical protein
MGVGEIAASIGRAKTEMPRAALSKCIEIPFVFKTWLFCILWLYLTMNFLIDIRLSIVSLHIYTPGFVLSLFHTIEYVLAG